MKQRLDARDIGALGRHELVQRVLERLGQFLLGVRKNGQVVPCHRARERQRRRPASGVVFLVGAVRVDLRAHFLQELLEMEHCVRYTTYLASVPDQSCLLYTSPSPRDS